MDFETHPVGTERELKELRAKLAMRNQLPYEESNSREDIEFGDWIDGLETPKHIPGDGLIIEAWRVNGYWKHRRGFAKVKPEQAALTLLHSEEPKPAAVVEWLRKMAAIQ